MSDLEDNIIENLNKHDIKSQRELIFEKENLIKSKLKYN
jgi:hypothetical protein